MKLQTYKLLADLNTFADVGDHTPMRAGQVVYGWPYADWGLCGPDDIAVMVIPMDVATIYAVPRASLSMGEVVDLSVSVRSLKFSCVDSSP